MLLLCWWLLVVAAASGNAHMSIWHPAMYGWAQREDAAIFINPLLSLPKKQWWFRGLSKQKTGGGIVKLPAGGKITLEIACHVAWTSYSPNKQTITEANDPLAACPGNSGAYHSGDPRAKLPDDNLLSGCALAIADTDDISKVTMDNLVVFSTNQSCVRSKFTDFHVPALMPPSSRKHSICAWFWLANNGTANFYMTGFDCKITNVSKKARQISKPKIPAFTGCTAEGHTFKGKRSVAGAKTPLYAYNQGSNQPFVHNYCRAGYHDMWSFPINGAQNDIFTGQLCDKQKRQPKSKHKRRISQYSQH